MSLVDGCKVLRTLQSIKSLVDDGPKDEITTQVWTFTRQETQLSEDFILGMQDFSDASFTRGVDLSKAQEAEQLVNQFVEKTSEGKVKNAFKDLNSSSDLLFLTLFNFQGVSLLPLRTYKTNSVFVKYRFYRSAKHSQDTCRRADLSTSIAFS